MAHAKMTIRHYKSSLDMTLTRVICQFTHVNCCSLSNEAISCRAGRTQQECSLLSHVGILDSIVVSISACHVEGPGSIPGRGGLFSTTSNNSFLRFQASTHFAQSITTLSIVVVWFDDSSQRTASSIVIQVCTTASDHTTVNIPVLVRSPKSSTVGPRQYLHG